MKTWLVSRLREDLNTLREDFISLREDFNALRKDFNEMLREIRTINAGLEGLKDPLRS